MKTYNNIINIDLNAPQPDRIQMAVEAISQGQIVIFPTTCLYGLAADAFNPLAVQKIFQMKKRSDKDPLLVLVKNREAMECLVKSVPSVAVTLMERFWPGEITLVFEAGKNVLKTLTAGTGKIGIRMPIHKVAVALVNALENPITGTSANLSKQGGCSQISNLHPEVIQPSNLILNAGSLKGGIGSTVIDVTVVPPVILREGAVSVEQIHETLGVGHT